MSRAHRLRDIGDALIELEDLLAAPAQEDLGRKKTAITRRTAIRSALRTVSRESFSTARSVQVTWCPSVSKHAAGEASPKGCRLSS